MPNWSQEQKRNAKTILRVGKQMGMNTRDRQIALMTAMQESSLRNLDYGDRDSRGLFQQRPSQGWGSPSQVTDPVYASRKFYSTLQGVGDRNDMPTWMAAQQVQRSAYPRAYAKWQDDAAKLVGAKPGLDTGSYDSFDEQYGLTTQIKKTKEKFGTFDASPHGSQTPGQQQGASAASAPGTQAASAPGVQAATAPGAGSPEPIGAADSLAPTDAPELPSEEPVDIEGTRVTEFPKVEALQNMSDKRERVTSLAQNHLGTPYKWGGQTPSGFDCSGLVQYVYGKMGVDLPRVSFQQARSGPRIGLGQLKPGDLVAWDNSSRNHGADHIAIFIGNGQIIEAPEPGKNVRIRDLGDDEDAWGVRMDLD